MTNNDLSFIIPALNEEEHIGGVLESIRENCDGRFQYEVILIDNGSNDQTVDIAKKMGATCLQAPGCSISSLRNLGVSESNSDIFVFLDADVYLEVDWHEQIGEVLGRLKNRPQVISGSLYGISKENNWIEKVWFAPRTTQKNATYINGGHLIVHRDLFSKVGGFDPDLETGEDYDFCTRARRVGAQIENNPELKVVHAGYPKTVKRFFGRERWHARGDYRSLKDLAASRPALISLANLVMAIVAIMIAVVGILPWFVCVLIYLLFLAGVSLAAAVHRNRGHLASGLWMVVFLYMIYFSARSLSIIDVAKQHLGKKACLRR